MKKNMKLMFEASEQEKKEILEQHSLFKKVLQSKVTRLMVNEQAQSTGGGVEFLKAAREKGCKIAVGGVIKSAPGKPSVLYKVADYDSANGYFKKGDELYIKDDFTFDVVTTDASGNKTLSATNKKWACPALTKPVEDQVTANIEKTKQEGNWKTKEEVLKIDTEQNIENPKMYEKKVVNGTTLYRNLSDVGINKALTKKGQDVLAYYQNNGALLQSEVNPEQAQTYTKIKIGSNPDFSEDFYVYLDPTKVTDPTMLATIQANIDKTIPQDKKVCKKAIEDYYTNFKKKRVVLPNELIKMKSDVQACKNEFYKDWGFFGGKKIDDMLDVMSGGVGGPSRRGEDSKWLLN
jgi:tetratricopeptide (TPR) repeat protein